MDLFDEEGEFGDEEEGQEKEAKKQKISGQQAGNGEGKVNSKNKNEDEDEDEVGFSHQKAVFWSLRTCDIFGSRQELVKIAICWTCLPECRVIPHKALHPRNCLAGS